jgi:ABC-2 type transport system permease protein
MTSPRGTVGAETTEMRTGAAVAPAPGARTSLAAGVRAVYAGQLSRARVSRGPLLFVATLQSLGILVLLRGVVHAGHATASSVVAGSTVLVVAFVALNLLAQRFGALRAAGALDYYAALPVPAAAVVLGTAASYATFTVPGALVTAAVGALVYGLPLGHLWIAVPAVLAAGVALSGVGAALGLAMPRPDLATVAGQLGMTAVLFLGVIPPGHLPGVLRAVRQAVPSTYAVDALAAALRGTPTVGGVLWRLAASVAYGVVALAVSGVLFRRAVAR